MTQIATDKEQSARLVACGVHSKGADMTLSYNNGVYELIAEPYHYFCFNEEDVPAWSLSALLALLPMDLTWQGLYYRLVMGPNKKGWEMEYNDLSILNNRHRVTADNLIEACVRMIEWLTANNYKLNNNE